MNKSSNLFILVAGMLAPVAVILSVCAGAFSYFPGDLWISQAVQSFISPGLTAFLKGVSWSSGDWHAAMLVIPAWLLIWWKAGFRDGFLVLLAGGISLVNEGFKVVIGRPRPSPELVQVLMPYHSNSFPSGHLFFAVLFLGILVYLFCERIPKTLWRIVVLFLAILIALLIGFARIYLGLHWASDVLGGAVYGGFFLCLLIGLAPVIRLKNRPAGIS